MSTQAHGNVFIAELKPLPRQPQAYSQIEARVQQGPGRSDSQNPAIGKNKDFIETFATSFSNWYPNGEIVRIAVAAQEDQSTDYRLLIEGT